MLGRRPRWTSICLLGPVPGRRLFFWRHLLSGVLVPARFFLFGCARFCLSAVRASPAAASVPRLDARIHARRISIREYHRWSRMASRTLLGALSTAPTAGLSSMGHAVCCSITSSEGDYQGMPSPCTWTGKGLPMVRKTAPYVAHGSVQCRRQVCAT